MRSEHPLHFFLGANTPAGFVSFYDQITSYTEKGHVFLVKGGPGSGKSSLMARVAETLAQAEPGMEFIHCSSDPDSLDGIICPQSGIAMVDATPPHVLEPQYPGACETVVNLCACWDEEALQHRREDVLTLSRQISACHQQCVRFLNAAHSILADNYTIALNAVNAAKAAKTAAGIVSRECRRVKRGQATEKRRLLSAITPKGNIGFTAPLKKACPRIYYLKDPYGAASNLLLTAIRALLSEYHLAFYTCFCPLNPYGKIDHILIPELGLAFITGSKAFPEEDLPEPYRVISFSRFTDMEQLAQRKQRLRFNRRAAGEILDAAVRSLRRAKSIHDILERVYGSAMDFSAVAETADAAVSQALSCQAEALEGPASPEKE